MLDPIKDFPPKCHLISLALSGMALLSKIYSNFITQLRFLFATFSLHLSLPRPVHPQRKMYFGISINSKIRSSKKMLLVVLLWTLDISAVNKKNFRLFAREKKSADIGGGKKKPRHFCGVRNTPNGIL